LILGNSVFHNSKIPRERMSLFHHQRRKTKISHSPFLSSIHISVFPFLYYTLWRVLLLPIYHLPLSHFLLWRRTHTLTHMHTYDDIWTEILHPFIIGKLCCCNHNTHETHIHIKSVTLFQCSQTLLSLFLSTLHIFVVQILTSQKLAQSEGIFIFCIKYMKY